MRKLVLKMSMSLDGFVSGPNGELDWLPDDDDPGATEWTMESLRETDLHLVGAHTYGDMAQYWPVSTGPFAESMNTVPKVVFSRSGKFERGDWVEPQILADLRDDIMRLKQQPGKVLLAHGGAMLAQELVASELIDEYRLLVHPVAIGDGKPLFPQLKSPRNLRLVRSIPFASGSIAIVYRPT